MKTQEVILPENVEIPVEKFRAALANVQAATETLLRYPDLDPIVAQQFYSIILDEIHRLTSYIPIEI
jgi:predicted thioredoxin/glutaredoxin